MKRLPKLLMLCCMVMMLSISAYAQDYQFDAPDVGLFATPTSDDTIYVTTNSASTDVSKNAALIPPIFGSATSYTTLSGTYLTPNLVEQTTTASTYTVSSAVVSLPSSIATTSSTMTYSYTSYTEVTADMYNSSGALGTLKIPAIDLTVSVYQGTDTTTLSKGAGHFEDTSIWDGNVAIAAHNRGVTNHFGELYTLDIGDEIYWYTTLGTRVYEVYSVEKIHLTDLSVLADSSDNIITLITCVADESDYRWCIKAIA